MQNDNDRLRSKEVQQLLHRLPKGFILWANSLVVLALFTFLFTLKSYKTTVSGKYPLTIVNVDSIDKIRCLLTVKMNNPLPGDGLKLKRAMLILYGFKLDTEVVHVDILTKNSNHLLTLEAYVDKPTSGINKIVKLENIEKGFTGILQTKPDTVSILSLFIRKMTNSKIQGYF